PHPSTANHPQRYQNAGERQGASRESLVLEADRYLSTMNCDGREQVFKRGLCLMFSAYSL
ncbi:hypothetical protein KUCAC02_005232, partial [Chaenocephalus aceratus]